jgi:hypothetical protein
LGRLRKRIHVKPLVPAGRFNMDKIMKTYAAAAKTEGEVQISSACRRQLRFWLLFLRVCSGQVDIPRPVGVATAVALDAFTDVTVGSSETIGRGSGGVLGSCWYYIPWARRINAGGWKVDGKKVGRKLSALELAGPLILAGGQEGHPLLGCGAQDGGSAVQGKVRRIQAGGGRRRLGAAGRPGGNTEGVAQMAGQARTVRRPGRRNPE